MKRLYSLLLTLLLAAALTLPATAAEVLTESRAVTMVPLRAVAEALHVTVAWDGSLPGARLTWNDREAVVVLGQSHATLIDHALGGDPVMGQPIPLSAAPAFLAPGAIYVPADFFHQIFEGGVIISEGGVISVVVNTTPTVGGGMQLPNPIHTHEAAEAVMAAVGFPFPVPEPPAGFSGSGYADIGGTVAELRWSDGIQELTYRINRGGSSSRDNSGDYTLYPASGTLAVGGATVHWRGESGSIRVAVWATEGFIHSLRSTEGLTESQLRPMIAATLPE